MTKHTIVGHEQWIEARKALLEKEKEVTRARDALATARRDLPWEKVDEPYVFEGPDGPVPLADLFAGCSQLIVYHFMFDPSWDAGCKSCSFMADHFNPAIIHLAQRDVSMVAVSKAPIETLAGFKKRMGWTFPWVSSFKNDFNRNYDVSFTPDELKKGGVTYNYEKTTFPATEAPGLSVFYKDDDGAIYHTYSSYARSLDTFLTTYQFLDIVPKGRDETDLDYSMAWIRLHDEYDTAAQAAE